MDGTIVVGALGVVATAVTAWIGSWNTRRATERTVEAGAATNRATLAAAREDRLWEKRAAAYEASLTELLYRQAHRQYELRKYRLDDDSEQKLKDFYEDYELPGVFEAQSRLVAYSSDAVVDAFQATKTAHAAVRMAYSRVEMFREQIRAAQANGSPRSAPDGDEIMDAQHKLDDELEAADATDEALIKVIRDELRSRPEAALPPTRLPAVRRRFQLRHRG